MDALRWPLPATAVTSLFGPRIDPMVGDTRFHYGVDLLGDEGQVVSAAAAGVVELADWRGGHGRHIVLAHPGGVYTSYSHLRSMFVHPGMSVAAGQAIGEVGQSGRSTGPHLHFEVTCHGVHVDPLQVLGVHGALRSPP
jgi:murein DD-endopeptidase MepM/ murein hydrolase activator NlpD